MLNDAGTQLCDRVVTVVEEQPGGITYDELRRSVSDETREVLNRVLVQAMRAGRITIHAGRYVIRS